MTNRLLLLICIMLSFVRLSCADDGSYTEYPQSGTVYPANNNDIKMVSEEVIYKDEKITATFEFLNTTDREQIITIGFPVIGQFQEEGDGSGNDEFSENRSEEDRKQDLINYYQFKSNIDGQEVERELLKLSDKFLKEGYEYVFITKVKFKPWQRIIIVDVYNQKESNGGSISGDYINKISYILKTGASWKDKIDHAKLIFYLPGSENRYWFGPDGLFNKFFENYFISNIPVTNTLGCVYEWEFRDFEPTEDLFCEWGQRPTELGYYNDELTRDIYNRNIRKNDKHKGFINKMQNEQTFSSYIKALAQGKLFKQMPNKGQPTEGYFIEKLKLINIRFVVNSLFALKGYTFKEPEWSEFYKNFGWYKPITDKPEFSQEERDLIERLNEIESVQ